METRSKSFIAVVGSQNYNLATPYSDVDKLHFVYPSWEDLYQGKFVKDQATSDSLDYAVHDVRKFAHYLCKGSPNFIEALFTVRATISDSLFEELRGLRSSIARMNLPSLYHACRGMFRQQQSKAEKEVFNNPSDTKAVGKHIASAIRIAQLLIRFQESGFNNYDNALWYKSNSPEQLELTRLKEGKQSYEKLLFYIDRLDEYDDTISRLYDSYVHNKVDSKTEKLVNDIVGEFVQLNIAEELKRGLK
ncbi:nucleotidyltransferase [Bacillus phage vB_BsuM-Goe3]|uniref:Nucleotidyltransferase n=1 Tax=Bacillus phage vB_BsuM-Goe3 TaxID=1933063 RepID=A0A217ER03_BPGO3|nr:nucleotidyltransferase [Bacillus phage vB_BsuM-Goe3]APZ82502.1 nucleotidyltransferase [Bacillus phage vB_BsuM-Goe3]